MIRSSEFKPAWWLATAHGQTMFATLIRRVSAPVSRVERMELPDGDFIDLAWADKECEPGSPLVILLHGLGGNLKSKYVAGLMNACNQSGWRVVLMHFRGASEEANRKPRAYHSGDTLDFDFLLRELDSREPNTLKAAVGISLGGNVLLKWLGEQQKQSLLDTAVAVSVPFELRLVADKMCQGFSKIYQRYLLRKLRQVFSRKTLKHGEPLPQALQDYDKWECFWTFDDNVTAPLNGFSSVHDYYRQSSSRKFLADIATPTLIIHAMDDPFMTTAALPGENELSRWVTLELSEKGGHVGFIGGNLPGKPVYWLEKRIPSWLRGVFHTQ